MSDNYPDPPVPDFKDARIAELEAEVARLRKSIWRAVDVLVMDMPSDSATGTIADATRAALGDG